MVAVDICNLALSYLGDTATVASIDPPEGSAQAQHCARFYPVALNLLLEAHQWNFVTRRAYLAVVETCFFDTWRYAYALPSDAANVISVLPKACYPVDVVAAPDLQVSPLRCASVEMTELGLFELNAPVDFQIETVNGQSVILSNVEDAVARYTVTTVQPGMFPALFTDALAWKLASMLAGPLLKGDAGAAESKRCLSMHAIIAAQAMGQDANERHGGGRFVASGIRARL